MTEILDDSAVSEIEALPYITVGWGRRVELTVEQRDALCATVKHLRAENEALNEAAERDRRHVNAKQSLLAGTQVRLAQVEQERDALIHTLETISIRERCDGI